MFAHACLMRVGAGVVTTQASAGTRPRGLRFANTNGNGRPIATKRGASRSSVLSVRASAKEEEEASEASPPSPSQPSPGYGGPNMYADSQAIAPPSPRRVFLGVLATTGVALGGNFLGVTGMLLGDYPDVASNLRLDIIYPVNGLKRCYNPEKGYEFVYPSDYLGDATVATRNANRQASATSLDPGSLTQSSGKQIFGQVVQGPNSAFGPMGTTGEENVSVIVSRSPPGGFRLDRFGDAKSQAEWLLANVLAREGSGKTAELYDAYTRKSTTGSTNYYTFEYTIRTDTWYRHNVAVFAEFGGKLFTLVAQVPETQWKERDADFRNIAESFKVFVPTG